MAGARIIGVLDGSATEPRVAFLGPGVRLEPDAAARAAAPMPPTEVFRYAAVCEQSHCQHFGAGRCALAKRIVDQLEPVVDALPVCQIRASCRWFAEQAGAACRRCPQVLTRIRFGDDPLSRAALPPVNELEPRPEP